MDNSHRFFNNQKCKYFPCHKISNKKFNKNNFNCLFCYCPLYPLGDKCSGNIKYSGDKGIKDCKDCFLPHIPEFYDTIVSILEK